MSETHLLPELLSLQTTQFEFLAEFVGRVRHHRVDGLMPTVTTEAIQAFAKSFSKLTRALAPEAPDYALALEHLQVFIDCSTELLTQGPEDSDPHNVETVIAVMEMVGGAKMLGFTLHTLKKVVPSEHPARPEVGDKVIVGHLIRTLEALRRRGYEIPDDYSATIAVEVEGDVPDWLQVVDRSLMHLKTFETTAEAPELAVIVRALEHRLSILAFTSDKDEREAFAECIHAAQALGRTLPPPLLREPSKDVSTRAAGRFSATMSIDRDDKHRGVLGFLAELQAAVNKRSKWADEVNEAMSAFDGVDSLIANDLRRHGQGRLWQAEFKDGERIDDAKRLKVPGLEEAASSPRAGRKPGRLRAMVAHEAEKRGMTGLADVLRKSAEGQEAADKLVAGYRAKQAPLRDYQRQAGSTQPALRDGHRVERTPGIMADETHHTPRGSWEGVVGHEEEEGDGPTDAARDAVAEALGGVPIDPVMDPESAQVKQADTIVGMVIARAFIRPEEAKTLLDNLRDPKVLIDTLTGSNIEEVAHKMKIVGELNEDQERRISNALYQLEAETDAGLAGLHELSAQAAVAREAEEGVARLAMPFALDFLDDESESAQALAKYVLSLLSVTHLKQLLPGGLSDQACAEIAERMDELWVVADPEDRDQAEDIFVSMLFAYCRERMGQDLEVGPSIKHIGESGSLRHGYIANLNMLVYDYFRDVDFNDSRERDLLSMAILDIVFGRSPNKEASARIRQDRQGRLVESVSLTERVERCRALMGISGEADVPAYEPQRREHELRVAAEMGWQFGLPNDTYWPILKDWNGRLSASFEDRELSVAVAHVYEARDPETWGRQLARSVEGKPHWTLFSTPAEDADPRDKIAAVPAFERIELCRDALGLDRGRIPVVGDRAAFARAAAGLGVEFALSKAEFWPIFMEWGYKSDPVYGDQYLRAVLNHEYDAPINTRWGLSLLAHVETMQELEALERSGGLDEARGEAARILNSKMAVSFDTIEAIVGEPEPEDDSFSAEVTASLLSMVIETDLDNPVVLMHPDHAQTFDIDGWTLKLTQAELDGVGSWAAAAHLEASDNAVKAPAPPLILRNSLPDGHFYKDWRTPENPWERFVQEAVSPDCVMPLRDAIAETLMSAARPEEARVVPKDATCFRLFGKQGKSTLCRIIERTVAHVQGHFDENSDLHREGAGLGYMADAVGFRSLVHPVRETAYGVVWLDGDGLVTQRKWDQIDTLFEILEDLVSDVYDQVTLDNAPDLQFAAGLIDWFRRAQKVHEDTVAGEKLAYPVGADESKALFPSMEACRPHYTKSGERLFARFQGALIMLFDRLYSLQCDYEASGSAPHNARFLYGSHPRGIECIFEGKAQPGFAERVDVLDVVAWVEDLIQDQLEPSDNPHENKLAQAGQRMVDAGIIAEPETDNEDASDEDADDESP